MAGMKISDLDFVRLLPAFMRDDAAVIALSKAMNKLLGEPGKRLGTIRTWDKIDELNEAECDELAWELDIDWYDPIDMSIEEKRETIKAAQQIKRKRGTKASVERLISAYFGEGYVLEWYETGGEPFTFTVLHTNANISQETYSKFFNAAIAAKNVHSRVDRFYYLWQQGPNAGVECAPVSAVHRYSYEQCGTRYHAPTVGLAVRHSAEAEPEETLCLYSYTKAGTVVCGEL